MKNEIDLNYKKKALIIQYFKNYIKELIEVAKSYEYISKDQSTVHEFELFDKIIRNTKCIISSTTACGFESPLSECFTYSKSPENSVKISDLIDFLNSEIEHLNTNKEMNIKELSEYKDNLILRVTNKFMN